MLVAEKNKALEHEIAKMQATIQQKMNDLLALKDRVVQY